MFGIIPQTLMLVRSDIHGQVMNVNKLVILISIIVALTFIGISIFATLQLIKLQKNKKEQRQALGRDISSPLTVQFNKYAQKGYNLLIRVPGLKRFLLNVRKRIETMAIYDEYTLRREVMKIVFTLFAIVILTVMVLIVVQPAWVIAFWVLLGLLFISGILIDFFVYRVEEKLNKQMKDFNNRTRFSYQYKKIVDEAIYDSIQFAGPEMRIQAEHIHNILTDAEPEKKLSKYDEVAPSRFLKVIAGLSHLVKEFGDKFSDEKGSAYLRGLNAVNQELNNDIIYRTKVNHKLRSLSTLTIIPIFCALPIKLWSVKSFPIMNNFYESRIGFLLEVFIYFISVLSYLVIRKMRQITENTHSIKVKRTRWEQKLFEKFPILHKFAIFLSPKQYTKNYFKLKKLIKDANEPYKVEEVTLHRIIIGICMTIILVSGFMYSHIREENNILNSTTSLAMLVGAQTQEELLKEKEMTEFDKEVIQKMGSSDNPFTGDNLKKYIAAHLKLDPDDKSVDAAYQRILSKWQVVENSYFKWWELLISLGVAFLATYIPIFNMQFKRSLRLKQMEIEVHQHLVLISSLREFDSMSVFMILTWIERFTVIFKEPVQICIQDFDSGPDEALKRLSEQVNFEPFQQLVERLKLALVRISIKEAFDDIDTEREFYLDQRKEIQEQSIESKEIYGNFWGLLPVMCLCLLYLAMPLIYISLVENNRLMNYLQ